MAPIEDFAQAWKTQSWTVDGKGPIPANAFQDRGTLNISVIPLIPVCELSWENAEGRQCTITGLPFTGGKLFAENFTVNFGGRSIGPLTVEFTIPAPGELRGNMSHGASDGNTGTYIAEANPPVPPPKVRVELASA